MFVDKATVTVQAGDGGNGAVSFRHEKFIDRGGPNGGDGGDGGNVILIASRNQHTLAAFRYQKLLKAANGQAGGKSRKHGKSGKDLIIAVPVGTVVVGADGKNVADLTDDNQQAVIARGGKGGFGNAHFVSSTRQAPRVAEKGEQGERQNLTLELKMIADVGIIGLPNAGKSTLLATISNARPEIANYPFTTIHPNLGVVDLDDKHSLLFADIPGLIAGASQGKGLGDDFLRHVERTAVLLHLIDAHQEHVADAYETIQSELKAYKVNLSRRPQIIVLSKIDGLSQAALKTKQAELKKILPKTSRLIMISSIAKEGVQELLFQAQKVVDATRKKQTAAKKKLSLPVIRLTDDSSWHITKDPAGFLVSGQKIERFAARTDFSNPDSVARLKDIARKNGIIRELERSGIQPGETFHIGTHSIEY